MGLSFSRFKTRWKRCRSLTGLKLNFNITGSGTDTAPGTFSSTGVEGLESDPGATCHGRAAVLQRLH